MRRECDGFVSTFESAVARFIEGQVTAFSAENARFARLRESTCLTDIQGALTEYRSTVAPKTAAEQHERNIKRNVLLELAEKSMDGMLLLTREPTQFEGNDFLMQAIDAQIGKVEGIRDQLVQARDSAAARVSRHTSELQQKSKAMLEQNNETIEHTFHQSSAFLENEWMQIEREKTSRLSKLEQELEGLRSQERQYVQGNFDASFASYNQVLKEVKDIEALITETCSSSTHDHMQKKFEKVSEHVRAAKQEPFPEPAFKRRCMRRFRP